MSKRTQKFVYSTPDGQMTLKVRIRPALQPVVIRLTAQHVREASKHKGYGDASRCAGAFCLRDHTAAFPHPVLGPGVWADSTMFALTKINKLGQPMQCIQYEHAHPEISRQFDLGKKGVKKLLKMIDDKGGFIDIVLKPKRFRMGESKRLGSGAHTGERTPRINHGGAVGRRFIRAREGMTPL